MLNAELRIPVRGVLGAVAFVDGGNVFRTVDEMDLSALRAAVGFGLRYRSPVGPIRVDLGIKLDRRVLPTGQSRAADRASHQPGTGILMIELGQRAEGRGQRAWRVLAVAFISLLSVLCSPASGEIIDRVLAILPGQIITQTDVQAALDLGLVEGSAGNDRIATGLSALIDRVLMLNEVRRVMPPEPSAGRG